MSNLLSSLIESLKEKAAIADYIVYVKNLQEEFVWMNAYAKEVLKNDKDGKIKKALFANDLEIVREDKCVSKVYFIESPRDVTNPLTNNDRSFAFTKWPAKNEGGSECYLVGFGFEITDWLVEVATLNFFKNALNSMTDSFVITTPNYPYKILYCNSSFESLAGKSRKEILGRTPTQIFKKFDEDEEVRKIFNEKIANYEIAEATLKNRNCLGHEFISHLKVIPLWFEQKSSTRPDCDKPDCDKPDYLMGIQRDISATYQLRKATREKAVKLKALFNATSNYIWLLDSEGYVSEMNDSARLQGKYLGLYSKILFKDGRWWNENRSEIDDFCEQVFVSKKPLKLKTKLYTSLDNFIDVQLVATPMDDCIVVEGTDVTELEQSLENAKSVAVGALQNALPKEDIQMSEIDENYLREFSNGQTERVVKAEVGIRNLQPAVRKLNQAVFDPKDGLIVKTDSIDSKLDDIKEALINPEAVRFFKGIPKLLDNRVIKWILILTFGTAGINVVNNAVHNIDDFFNYLQEQSEEVDAPSSNP